jgi:adenylate cyclase
MRQQLVRAVVFTTIWSLVFLYYVMMRNFGIEELPGVERTVSVPLTAMILMSLAAGVVIGVPYSIADALFDTTQFKRRSYGTILLVKGTVQLLVTLLAGAAIIVVATVVLQLAPEGPWERLREMLFSRSAFMLVVTSFAVSFALNFFDIVQAKIGLRVLLNLLRGRYHHPSEEERFFMFLDLRSSTTYAERLGNIRYSSLIQDCFSDLTDVIRQHRVEVYQYVGDEAVLTWTIPDGIEDSNCIQAFFHFTDVLRERGAHYEREYGFVPEFKAGVNCGVVTVAEVGIVKREIAYHSDVLNTAARIQAECNAYGKELLVSEYVEQKLPYDPRLVVELVGDIVLRGKELSVKIYSVDRKVLIAE